jgi:hypothetical protein
MLMPRQNADTLRDLEDQRARQDRAMNDALDRLQSLGDGTVVIPREALDAIHRACLVRLSPNQPALRG